jgi:lipoate-protein ligase A
VNDLIAGNRKISGSGVGEIGECIVFVGNLMLDFDYETMSRILKVPDEKFRDKVEKTIEGNLTTIRMELGDKKAAQWKETDLNALMAEEFEKILGPLVPGEKESGIGLQDWMKLLQI